MTRLAVAAGATIFTAGSLAALATGQMDHDPVIVPAPAVAHEAQIERIVATHHLGIGFAGYWNAAALQWSSDGALQVYPIVSDDKGASPMLFERAAAWFAPRPDTPSYIVRGPSYEWIADRVPSRLPPPTRVFHVGKTIIDAWPYDIAAFMSRSGIPVPGLTRARMRSARQADLAQTPAR